MNYCLCNRVMYRYYNKMQWFLSVFCSNQQQCFFVCLFVLYLQLVVYVNTASFKLIQHFSLMQNMKEIFLNTDLQQKMNFGKRKVHIHSTKKTKKGNNNNCSFAISLFLSFCFYIEYFTQTQHIFLNITFLFAINMNEIY